MRALIVGAVVVLILVVGYLVMRQNSMTPSMTPEEQFAEELRQSDELKAEAMEKRRAAMEEAMRKQTEQNQGEAK